MNMNGSGKGIYNLIFCLLLLFFGRQRYISATCGMALLRDVPQEVMFRVLIERINIVTFLPWLRAAAVPNENQLDFVMAGNDRKQWQVVLVHLHLLLCGACPS